MNSAVLDNRTLERLRQHAIKQGCTVDALLRQWLDENSENSVPPRIYKRLLDHTRDIVSLFDLELRYLYVNPILGELLGIDTAEMIGKSDLELGVPEDKAALLHESWEIVIDEHKEQIVSFEYETANGPLALESRLSPIFDDQGELRWLLAITRDVTQRNQTEQELRRSETRLRSLVDSQTAMVVRTDMEGNFTYCNSAWQQRFSWMESLFIGQSCLQTILPIDHHKMLQSAMDCIQQPGKPVTVVLRKPAPENRVMWTLWEFVAITDSENTPTEVQCIGFDITELEKSREQLKLQESALLATANAIVITDRHANIEWVNPAFTSLTGYTWDEAHGKNPNILVKSGYHDQEFYEAMWDTITAGKVWIGKMINRRKDGTYYTEEQTVTPVYGESGEITHFVAIKQDITEREQANQIALENERLKARIQVEQERTTLIQQTVSALSHDLRAPLSVISSSRNILSLYFDRISDDQRKQKLDTIGRQLQYALELLDDTVMVVKGNLNHRVFQPSPINLDSLCRLSLAEMNETNNKQHPLVYTNIAHVDVAPVDEILVSRILLNLLSNAMKYSPDGSEIKLELDRQEDQVILRVIDQGIGIDEHDLPRIFEPFFRARDARSRHGSGLGLSIVKDCVERHQGTIKVESEVGRGTTFTVELPTK